MKKSAYSIAVVGATGLVGQEILQRLDERGFPLGALQLYASPRSAGDELRCAGVSARVELLDGARFDDTDLVFLAAGEQVSAEWVPRATDAGAVVIDTSQLFANDADVPLVVPEVNADSLADYSQRGLVASPDTAAVAMGIVLKPLQAAGILKRVVACTIESVSGAGRAGIEELQQQTVELMSGRSVDVALFQHGLSSTPEERLGSLPFACQSPCITVRFAAWLATPSSARPLPDTSCSTVLEKVAQPPSTRPSTPNMVPLR